MRIISLYLFCLLPGLVCHAAELRWHVTAEEWARPRHGEALVMMNAVKKSAQAFSTTNNSRMLIQYPGGEEGILWARELKDWLIAFGIASNKIELEPGLSRDDRVTIILIQQKDRSL